MINNIVDFLFFIDIILQSQCCYYEKSQLITNRWLILKRYVFGWFLIDLITVFPFEFMFNYLDFQKISFLGGFKFLRILRLLRLKDVLSKKIHDYKTSKIKGGKGCWCLVIL